MRETVEIRLFNIENHRITPACAGNRTANGGKARGEGDHPRVCGEQKKAIKTKKLPEGSPPRVRGTAKKSPPFLYDLRITPACAGNRNTRKFLWPRRWDHPRVCGEQLRSLPPYPYHSGSPPRVRGTAYKRAYRSHQ